MALYRTSSGVHRLPNDPALRRGICACCKDEQTGLPCPGITPGDEPLAIQWTWLDNNYADNPALCPSGTHCQDIFALGTIRLENVGACEYEAYFPCGNDTDVLRVDFQPTGMQVWTLRLLDAFPGDLNNRAEGTHIWNGGRPYERGDLPQDVTLVPLNPSVAGTSWPCQSGQNAWWLPENYNTVRIEALSTVAAAEAQRMAFTDLPCSHRGRVTRPARRGCRKEELAECALHGVCSMRRIFGSNKACLTCEDRNG